MIYVSTSCLRYGDKKFHEDFIKVLDLYKELGIPAVELGASHKRFDNVKEVFKYKDDFKFIIHAMFPPQKEHVMLNIAAGDKLREFSILKAKEAIDYCRRLDAPIYGTHGGALARTDANGYAIGEIELSREEAMINIYRSLSEICEYANQYGVKIALENACAFLPHLLYITPDEYKLILKQVGSKNLGLLVDLGHLAISAKHNNFDPKWFINEVESKILEFHVHEVIDGHDHQELIDDQILKKFGISKSLAKKSCVTLESNWLTLETLKRSNELLHQAIKVLN